MTDEIIVPTEEELTNEAVLKFYEAFNQSFKPEESPIGDSLFKELRHGKKTIYNKSIRETKVFDGSFIDILRSAYPSLMKIVRDPKKAIKYEQEVVAMEKAKKFNAESIRHLASHTQYIKKVDESGFVTPSKVLTTYTDDTLNIYENKFIKSLINKVIMFLERRYKLMQQNIESYQADVVKYKNSALVEGTSFDIEVNVKIQNDLEEETSTAKKVLYDVETLLNLYKSLKGTPLYLSLAKTHDIVPPIMKTNIILHNPDFKIAYNTWVYLDRANTIGYNVDSKEKKHQDSENIALDMDKVGTVLLGQMIYHRGRKGYDFLKPRTYSRFNHKKAEVLNNESEYNLTPKDVRLEHQEVSEFLLTKTAEFYGKSLDESLSQGMSYDMSIKKVCREMLQIINDIYPSLFEREVEDLDVKSTNEQKLNTAKNQLKVLKMVREQKQIDLRKMDRTYSKLERQVSTLTTKVRNENKKKNSTTKTAKKVSK